MSPYDDFGPFWPYSLGMEVEGYLSKSKSGDILPLQVEIWRYFASLKN
jgi:hypothetical protein